jgi:hypothetical protein
MFEQNVGATPSLGTFQAFNYPLFEAVELLAVKGAGFASTQMQINFIVGREAEPWPQFSPVAVLTSESHGL